MNYRPWISRFDPNLRATANLSEAYRGHRFELFISRRGSATRTCALYIDGKQEVVQMVGPSDLDTIVAGIAAARRLIDHRIASPSGAASDPINEALVSDPGIAEIRWSDSPAGRSADEIRQPASAAEIVAIAERLGERQDDAALGLVRLIAEHCAELADESGALASGPDVARRIRQLFRL